MLRNNNSIADQVFAALAENADKNPYLRQVVRTSIPSGDCVRVHLRGQEINEATRQLVASAENEVLMQVYNFYHDSDAGHDFKLALIHLNDKATQNGKTININIMVNYRRGPAAFFTRGTDNPFSWLEQDNQGTFFCLDNTKHYMTGLNIKTSLHEHYFFDSFHTKQIIIDRKYIMLRGCDLAHTLNYRDGKTRNTELATTIESEDLAQSAAISFHANWKSGSSIQHKASYIAHAEGIPVLLLEKESSTDPTKRFGLPSPFKFAALECIKQAKHSVKIATPNINDTELLDALIDAINRDVTVILTTGEYSNEKRESMPGMGGTNINSVNYIYNKLPISKWDHFQVYWSHEKGQPDSISKQTMLHTKLIIIDDMIVITGSTPLDKQGMYHSAESDILIESAEVAEKFLEKIFRPLINEDHSNNLFKLKILKYSLAQDIRVAFLPFAADDTCLMDLEHLTGCIRSTSNFLSLCLSLMLLIQQEQATMGTASNTGLFNNRQHMQTLRRICEEHYIDIEKSHKL